MRWLHDPRTRRHPIGYALLIAILLLAVGAGLAEPLVDPILDLNPPIAFDGSQDLIVVGKFTDTVDLGGGPLVSSTGNALYLGKLSIDGTHHWSVAFEITGDTYWSHAVDASGNTLICGTFSGTLDLGGAPLTSAGDLDMFVAKFDPNGGHVWSAGFGDAGEQVRCKVVADPSGNVVLAGGQTGSLDLGGGPLTSAGVNDILLAKFDPNGTHLWSQMFGDASYQDCLNPVVDDAGNIVLAGHFMSTVDFGGGLRTSTDGYDMFLAEFSPAGALNWDLVFTGPNSQVCRSLTRAANGDLAVTAGFSGESDLGGGLLTPLGTYGAPVAVFDADGVHKWSAIFGTTYAFGSALAIDACGNLTLTGHFMDTADFGGGPLTSADGYDAFIARFDDTGRHVYSERFGDAGGQYGGGVLAVDCDEIVTSGWHSGLLDLGGGTYLPTGDVLGLAKLEFGHVRASLDDGLVAHWSFDADFTADTGGAVFDGTPYNGPSIDAYGRFGGSAYFERDNGEYVSIDQPIIAPGRDHSYSVWYKSALKDFPVGRYFVLESYPLHEVSFGFYDSTPDDLAQVYTMWPGSFSEVSFGGAAGAVWHNLVVTYDADDAGQEHTVYLDGTFVTSMASSDTLSAVDGMIIGSYRSHNDRFWDGWIDDVAVWDRVLTLDEIAALQSAPVGGDWVGCAPDSLTISLADDVGGGVYEEELVIRYLAVDASPVYAYSVDVTWDPLLVTATKDDFTRPDTGLFHDTLWFFVTDIPGGVRVDAALPGGSAGVTSGELFKATFTATSVVDYTAGVIDLSLTSFRDADNQDIAGVTADDGLVVVDLVAPSVSGVGIANTTLAHTDDYVKDGDAVVVTATVSDQDPELEASDIRADLSGLGGSSIAIADGYVGQVATWTIPAAACTPADGTVTVPVTATDNPGNSTIASDTIIADNTAPTAVTGFAAAPGHRKVDLTWDDPSGLDAYLDGVVVRYAAWGDYPDYATAAPDWPGGPAAGDGAAFDGTGAAATHAFGADDRDIYAYTAFAYDVARNYSPAAAGAQDMSTNYWLGDVGTGSAGPYDGQVTVADYSGLASTYGLAEGAGGWKGECDVGPTDDHSRVGLPEPDDSVQFEDLMIFAMNAGVASAKRLPPTGTPTPMLAWERLDANTWSLRLLEPCADLKGVNVAVRLAAGSATVSRGELLSRQDAPAFLQNIDRNGLDAGLALMGRDLGFVGSGELMRVRTTGEVDLADATITARGIDNADHGAEPALPGGGTPPARLSLFQNVPNPFNPQTKIVFSLPEDQPVRLTVYTLDGKRVRTLLDEPRPAGVHQVVWDGRDDRGRLTASGTYVYRLQAGPYGEMRKMSLMK